MNDGNNNGQATHGARKPPRPMFNTNRYIIIMFILLTHNAQMHWLKRNITEFTALI